MIRPACAASELEARLRNRFRRSPLYARLAFVKIIPSNGAACGWTAEFDGQFSEDERRQVHQAIFELQHRYSLLRQHIAHSR
jgi:hypothetical protein